MATRFYPAVKTPNVRLHGPLRGTWSRTTAFNSNWSPVQWRWRMATSKTDGGTLTTRTLSCNQTQNFFRAGEYDFHVAQHWTAPLQAQTISGTFDLCLQTAISWLDDLDPPANLSDVRYKVHIYITQGQTTTVRHVLLDNYLDTAALPYLTLRGQSLASAQALTAGDAQDGDCVVIEIGCRIVSSPTPAATQPPVNLTRIEWRGTGTNAATGDVTAGSTNATLNPWLEFSHNFAFAAAPAAPANDACADAITIAALPYTSSDIDTTESTDTNRGVWWTWTAPTSGKVFFHTWGSNYNARLDAYTDGCGVLTVAPFQRRQTSLSAHRSLCSLMFDAVSGTQYWIAVTSANQTNCAPQSGGLCRLSAGYRSEPEDGDVYLPCGNVLQLREGVTVNFNAALVGSNVTGVAIDYTGTPMTALFTGATNTNVRVLIGLHSSDLVEILNGPDLSYGDGQAEVDFISTPWATAVDKHPSQLVVTSTGVLYVGWFGTGYEFVAGLGALPAILYTVSDDLANQDVRSIDAWKGNSQTGAPFTDDTYRPAAEVTAPWGIALDEATGVLYYTSGGFYEPVGGQTIKRFNVLTNTQLADFATLAVPAAATNNPGLKGLCLLPDGGLLVCNATEVVKLNASGAVVGTYTPSVAEDSQCLVDVKLTPDGASLWTVDLATTRLYQASVASMTEIANYQTYQITSSLTQLAVYVAPAGESSVETVEREIRRLRRAPVLNEDKRWLFHSEIKLDLKTGIGLDGASTVQGHDPQVMLRYSDDGGRTWSDERWISAGTIGQYSRRAVWRRLGRSRNRIYEVVVTDPVAWQIVAAYVEAEGGTA